MPIQVKDKTLVIYFLLFITCVLGTTGAPKKKLDYWDENAPVFIPSNEWQEVKEGQAIPPGLHIRSNLQTGKTEARLMEKKGHQNSDANLPVVVAQEDPQLKRAENNLNREEVLKALHGIHEGQEDALDHEKALKDKLKKEKYRSYETLKKDFEKMQMHIRSDAENMKEILGHLQNSSGSSSAELVQIRLLTDLEYYLHQIDNAQQFCDLKGIQWMVQILNSSSDSLIVKSHYLYALSAAVHSNIKVQICAVQAGILPQLVQLLNQTLTEALRDNAGASKETVQLFSRIVGVLGGVVQEFPTAQYQWLKLNGLEGLARLYDAMEQWRSSHDSLVEASIRKQFVALELKMLTLLSDLQKERNSVMEHGDVSQQLERMRQYNLEDFGQRFLQSGWCHRLQQVTLRLTSPDSSSHDVREKTLQALEQLAPRICTRGNRDDNFLWHSAAMLELMQNLQAEYHQLAATEIQEPTAAAVSPGQHEDNEEERGCGYFCDLHHLVQKVSKLIAIKVEL